MSLVSNFIGGIGFNPGINGNNGVTSQFDLNDTTFAELLEKQLNNNINNSTPTNSIMDGLGMPPGIEIKPLEGTEFSDTVQDQMDAVGEKTNNIETDNSTNPFDMNGDGDVTTSEAVTFFTSLLDMGADGQNARSELFDFAKKQATDFYSKYSKNVVSNLTDLVDDIKRAV